MDDDKLCLLQVTVIWCNECTASRLVEARSPVREKGRSACQYISNMIIIINKVARRPIISKVG